MSNLLHRAAKYFARKSGTDEVTEAIAGDLTDFERRLLLEQDVMEVRGKVINIVHTYRVP